MIEIEHKFVVPSDYDFSQHEKQLQALRPTRTVHVQVSDRYFVLKNKLDFIYRFRRDKELQQLTVKSLGGDNERRTEVNLDLLMQPKPQDDRVLAFMETLGVEWSAEIKKEVRAYIFQDCEVAFYVARSGKNEVACLEFEALHVADLAKGREILHRYEKHLGFDAKDRNPNSLFDLLLVPSMPTNIREKYRRQ